MTIEELVNQVIPLIPYVLTVFSGLWGAYMYFSNRANREANVTETITDTDLDLVTGLHSEMKRLSDSNMALVASNKELLESNRELGRKVMALEVDVSAFKKAIMTNHSFESELISEVGSLVRENMELTEKCLKCPLLVSP